MSLFPQKNDVGHSLSLSISVFSVRTKNLKIKKKYLLSSNGPSRSKQNEKLKKKFPANLETLSERKQLKHFFVLFRAATARLNSNSNANHNAAKLPRSDGFSFLFVPKKAGEAAGRNYR